MKALVSRVLTAFLAIVIVSAGAPSQDSRRAEPPSIAYAGARTSAGSIETPNGIVFIDEGVAWNGVKVYLSLTWDVVATDEASGKVLWSQNVGAFWNGIGFKEIETAPGVKKWMVELRPSTIVRDGKDLRQYHDLKTGERLPGFDDQPKGKPIELAGRWSGRWSGWPKAIRRLVGTEADWKSSIVERMFPEGKDAPAFGPVDFATNVVLVVSMGEIVNCSGIEASAWEDDERVLVRLREHWFQTVGPDGGGQKVRPFGIFVLPKREPFKRVVLERNYQNLIGAPPIWKEHGRFDGLGDVKAASRPSK
jgi:hypothetical protein